MRSSERKVRRLTPHPSLATSLTLEAALALSPEGQGDARPSRLRQPQYFASPSPQNGSTGLLRFHSRLPSKPSTTARCMVSVVE
jgi:hypothetical protein